MTEKRIKAKRKRNRKEGNTHKAKNLKRKSNQ
jgi:hypothetical protein